MSRKSNKPIVIPSGVTVTIKDEMITVHGPKGELHHGLNSMVSAAVTSEGVVLTVQDPHEKSQRAVWGTTGALVRNMIRGVSEGYEIKLEINGVGYQFEVSGQKLTVKAGYSHPIMITAPEAITMRQEKNVLTLSSYDKQALGQVAAEIRKIRPPEPYKGKGIKYSNEVIVRKQGKQAAGSTS